MNSSIKTTELRKSIENQKPTHNMFYGIPTEEHKQYLLSEIEKYEKSFLDYVPETYEDFIVKMEEKFGDVDGLQASIEMQSYELMHTLVIKYHH